MIQEAKTHDAWIALRRHIATCNDFGACLRDWKGYAATTNRLKAWVAQMKCDVGSRCGTLWPADYTALEVDCTHYEDNSLCVGAMQEFIKQLDGVDKYNSCAIEYADWYHAHGP